MVAKMEGFSIRGYTVKMRTLDFKKSWPFGGDGPKDGIKGESSPPLPPMTVPSFRFWAHELPHMDRPPDPRLDLSAVIKLAARSLSGKGKHEGPKKRSIAELFAASPQVDAAEEADSREGDREEIDQNQGEEDRREDSTEGKLGSTDLGSDAVVSEAATPKPGKTRKRIWLNNYKKKRSTIRKRKRFGPAKKEKIQKHKISSALHIYRLLQGSVCKRSGNMGPVDDQIKKPPKVKSLSKKRSSKSLSKKRSSETVQSSKLLSENQEVAKVFPTKRKTLKGDAAGDNLIKSRRISRKNASFEDDKLEPNKKSFAMDMPQQLQSLCTEKDVSNPAAIESDHLLKESENGAAKASVPENTVRAESGKKQSVGDHCHAALPTDISSRNRLETEKTSLLGTIDLNYTVESFSNLNCLDSGGSAFSPESSDSGISRILNSTCVKGLNSNAGLQAEKTNSQFQAGENLLMTSNARTPVTMGVSRPPIADTKTTSRDEHIAVGVPLKSQGESAKSCSSAKFDLNDLFSMQNQLSGSESSSPVLNLNEPTNEMDRSKTNEKFPFIANDQLKRFQDPAGTPTVSSSGSIEMLGFGGIGVQKHESMRKSDPSFQKDPIPPAYHGSGEYAHNLIDREKFRAVKNLDNGTQPAFHGTMRLMGQDVSVPDVIVDRKRNGEQVADEHFHIPWPQREQVTHPQSGTSTVNHLHPLEDPSSVYHIPTADPRSGHKHSDIRPQWMPSSRHFFPIANNRSEVNRSYHSFRQEAFLASTSNSTINCHSLTNSVEMANPLPVMASHPRNFSQQMSHNSTHCNSQNFSHTNQATFFSPVPNHDNWNISESLSTHASSCFSQWLMNANQGDIHRANTDPTSVRHPFTIHGDNSLPLPPQIPTSVVPPLYNRNASNILGSSTQSELLPPSFVPSRSPTVNPVNGDNIKSRDGKESSFKYFKLLDHPNITRKRAGAGFDDFMRQVKKTNSTLHVNSDAPSGRRQIEQLLDCIPCNTGYPETPDHGNKVMDAARDGERYVFRTSPGSSSVKLGDGSNAGPIKLSAGAKHILRPSRNMDKDNCRPIPSIIQSIPLATVTSSGLISATQNRAAKIYRF